MPPIEDQAYMKLCAELASCQTISLSSARRQVEIAAAKKGVKDLNNRKLIAEALIKRIGSLKNSDNVSISKQFDQLLEAMASEENFMLED